MRRSRAIPVFRSFVDTNLHPHRNPDYAIVTISLKAHGATPGDATADQMRVIADLAERYGSRRDPDQPRAELHSAPRAQALRAGGACGRCGRQSLATANVGLASDIIACPGNGLLQSRHRPLHPRRPGHRDP